MFKRQNFSSLTLPIILFFLSAVISIFPNELHTNLKNMGLINLISTTLIVSAGVSISYGHYLRIKSKIIALKKFRDLEAVKTVNHYNAQIKEFQNAFNDIQNKLKVWEDKKKEHTPNQVKNNAENKAQRDADILEYNDSFKDWGIGNYGTIATLQSVYKTSDYGV